MAYSKAKLKSSDDKASPSFKPFLIGNISKFCISIYYYRFYLNNLLTEVILYGYQTQSEYRLLFETPFSFFLKYLMKVDYMTIS
jgi:hypothetical protein